MRPTLLHFRSPKEKTPEFYDVSLTHQGDTLHFRSKSLNRKLSNLPQAQRFPQYNFYQNNVGLSCFLGPGSYNDHDDFLKLTQQPCSIKMKKTSVLPEKESGKPCYIMVGNNLTFEPSYLSTTDQKRELQQLNADQCPVYLKSTLKRRSISNIKQRLSTSMRNMTEEESQKSDYVTLPQTISNQNGDYQQNQNNNLINSFYSKNNQQQRPMTCQNVNIAQANQQNIPAHQSAKASFSGKINGDFSNTLGATSSIMDKTTASDFNSLNVKQKDELGSLPEIQSLQNQEGYLSEENQVRIKSMLPKTAANFSKMKRGLYLNPVRGFPYNMKEEALARSINILAAYGEIIPTLTQSTKKQKRNVRSTSKKSKAHKSLMGDSVNMTPDQLHGTGYMNVIRDSPQIVNQRELLERQKREILNMQFDRNMKKNNSNNDMNKFLSDRYSSTDDQKETKTDISKSISNNDITNK